jgi:hypothetical protein
MRADSRALASDGLRWHTLTATVRAYGALAELAEGIERE